jgi:hypothetical protein
MPVTVSVNTVVVMSGIAILRTTAFRRPMARPVAAMLPVIFAVNTCPSAKKLAASTML